MNKYLLLTRSNIKKSKSQMITIIALVLIAAMFLNIWLVLSLDYSANYDIRSRELSSEHSFVVFSAADDEFKAICEQELNNNPSVSAYEISKTVFWSGNVKYSVGMINTNFLGISLSDAKSKSVGKYKLLNEQADFTESTVYIPYLFQSGGGYEVGDKFEIEIEQKSYTFTVGGFFENLMSGSMNGGVVSIILHDNALSDMQAELDYSSLSVSIRLKSGVDDKKFTSAFIEQVSNKRLVPYFSTWIKLNKSARTFIGGIAGSIIAMVAFLITFIVLIVIAFNISNKVQEDVKSLGVLKGIGYRSRQIILSVLLQFLGAALAACIVGIALSYAVLPLIASLLATQTGIIWQYGFSALSAGIVLALIGGVVSLVSFLSARRIKKITPMTALREGIETHNFKTNSFPLQKTKLNIHAALGLKSFTKNKKQNFAISIILALLTLVGVFAGTLFSNVAIDPEMFIKTITGESADIAIETRYEHSQEVYAALSANDGVKKAYMYHSNAVYIGDTDIMCYIFEDFSDLNNQMLCYDGRLPRHDNEVAIGGLFAKENGLKIGDVVKLRFNKPESEFIITGLTQSANYMGQDCMLTAAGFSKISDLLFQTYYVNVKENTDIDAVIAQIKTALPDKLISIVNVKAAEKGSAQVYIDMMSIISIAAILILLLVILLVLYLMVKTYVLKKRKELGILKALGYTTNQLIGQTLFSFLPSVILGALAGSILGIFLVNPLFTILLTSVGIMKSMFAISAPVILTVAIGIALFSLAVALVVAGRIRKITPHKLLLSV